MDPKYRLVAIRNNEPVDGFDLSTDEIDVIFNALNEYEDPFQQEDDNPSSVIMSKFHALFERCW